MAYAAEQSRISGQIIKVDELKEEIRGLINKEYRECGDDKCE
jgi:hypothetical protein